MREFGNRHPEIKLRKHSQLSAASMRVSAESVFASRRRLESGLKKLGCEDILKDPRRIINSDETNMDMNGKAVKCFASAEDKNCYEKLRAGGKLNRTVLVAANANGDFVPPFILLPGKRLPSALVEAARGSFNVQVTDNGWMNEMTYRFWIKNILSPWARKLKIKEPYALVDDNASCHDSPAISKLCDELNIIHMKLPPNTTHATQPLDVGFFAQFKLNYFRILQQHKDNNVNYCVTNETFIYLMKEVYAVAFKPESIKSGFKRSGIYPWNDGAIDTKKLIGKYKNEIVLEDFYEAGDDVSNGGDISAGASELNGGKLDEAAIDDEALYNERVSDHFYGARKVNGDDM